MPQDNVMPEWPPKRTLLGSFTFGNVIYELLMEPTKGVFRCSQADKPLASTEQITNPRRAAELFLQVIDEKLAAIRIICDAGQPARQRMFGATKQPSGDASVTDAR